MEVYVNPGNIAFDEINDENYVDKTMRISLVNERIRKKGKLQGRQSAQRDQAGVLLLSGSLCAV